MFSKEGNRFHKNQIRSRKHPPGSEQADRLRAAGFSHWSRLPPPGHVCELHSMDFCVRAKSFSPTLGDLMDRSLPGSSVHGILQARILEWVSMPSSRRFSRPSDQTQVSCISCIASRFSTTKAIREDLICYVERGNSYSPLADAPHQRSCMTRRKGLP